MFGSIAIRLFRYRKRFTWESSKTFHLFLTDTSLLEGRIFNSHHPLSQDVRQVCRIGEYQSIFPIQEKSFPAFATLF